MIDNQLLNAMREMLYYTAVSVTFVTLPTLIVGLAISIFQAATQINEVTMTFIPKMIVMFAMLYLMGPWLLQSLIGIAQHYFTNLNAYIR